MPPCNVHIGWSLAPIQEGQLQAYLANMSRLNTSLAPGLEEFLQPGVLETPDHA
jgi:hypothetical protein